MATSRKWKIHPSQPYKSPKFLEYLEGNPNGTELANCYLIKKAGERIVFNKQNNTISTDVQHDGLNKLLAKSERNAEIEKAIEYLSLDPAEKDLTVEESLGIKTSLYCINKKLTEKDIDNILFHQNSSLKNIILFSAPGTGKTSKVKDFLKKTGQKFIFLAPLRLQVLQMKGDKKLCTVMGRQKVDLSELIQNNDFIVSTYEYFPQIDKILSNQRHDYYLVIDEFHKMVSDSDYRNSSLSYIFNAMYKYGRFIGLTGTPLGCINHSLLNECGNVEIIKVKTLHDYIPVRGSYSIIQYKQLDAYERSDEKCFYSYIRSNIKDGISIIFANRKKLLERIKAMLISEGLASQGQCITLTSDEKDNPENLAIIDTKRLKNHKRFIFATSVMSTGINLKGKKFKNVFIYKERNLIEIVQFLHRFRQGIENVYDFIPENNDLVYVSNIKKRFNQYFDFYKSIADSFDAIYKHNYKLIQQYNFIKSDQLFGNGILYTMDNQVKVNENKIMWKALSDLHSVAFRNMDIRKQYLSLYGVAESIITKSDLKIYEHDFSNGDKLSKKMKIVLQNKVLEHLGTALYPIISFFKEKNILSIELFENRYVKRYIRTLSKSEAEFFENEFYDSLGKEEVKRTMSQFLFYYGTGISASTAIELVKRNQYDKITKAVKFIYLLQLTKLPNKEYEKYFDKDVIEELDFIENINKHMLRYRDNINFTELKGIINKYNSSSELIKHFKVSTITRLRCIYNINVTTAITSQNKVKKYEYVGLKTARDIFSSNKINATSGDIRDLDKYLNQADEIIRNKPNSSFTTAKHIIAKRLFPILNV